MNNNQEKEYLEMWTKKIVHVLESNKTDAALSNAILNILHNVIADENGWTICDTAILEKFLPMFLTSGSDEYDRAALHSIQSIIQALPENLKEELKQVDKTESDFPTEEENTNRSRQLVAKWLVNTRKKAAPEVTDLIEDLFKVFTTEYSTADTVEGIVDCLCNFDEHIRDDRDYKPAHDAADLMISIVKALGYKNKIVEHFDNIYIFWLNPEDGEIDYSEIKGIRLAELVDDIINNKNVPAPIAEAILTALAEISRTLPTEQVASFENSAEYINALFRAYAKNQTVETVENENNELSKPAVQLSELINNPNLPEEIVNGIIDGIDEFYNTKAEQSAVIAFRHSPEYIEMVLRGNKTSKTTFIPTAENVPSISDVPHSKPSKSRTSKPPVIKRPAKPTKQDKKKDK